MKILKVNYLEGQSRFVIEGYDKITFVVDISELSTKQAVLLALKAKVDNLSIDHNLEKYHSLDLKSLEGVEF